MRRLKLSLYFLSWAFQALWNPLGAEWFIESAVIGKAEAAKRLKSKRPKEFERL